MIPPDVASSLRLVLPDQQNNATNLQTQPVAGAQRITDLLSDMVPGQRILAEIQALLPNGTYRAVAAQRNITLALPFSAKPGDTLELEVTESNGHLTLAFVADRSSSNTSTTAQESVSTTLSQTGKLIGSLIGNNSPQTQQPAPAPLNGSQPLVEKMPESGAELAPLLKQALTQSGVFYEAHQARWVDGQLTVEALKQEPQGKLAPHSLLPPTASQEPIADINYDSKTAAAQSGHTLPNIPEPQASENRMPQEIATLVRQQLDGLANNNFTWQGQIWPGQQMRWEIGDSPGKDQSAPLSEEREWQSKLKLSLPSLGDIDVTLNLRPGGKVMLTINAESNTAEAHLRQQTEPLLTQFTTAGLEIIQLNIEHAPPEE